MGPFPPLTEFSPHEKELLAGMGVHVTKEKAKIGGFLPFIAGHLAEERSFSMHHFIVRKRQQKVL